LTEAPTLVDGPARRRDWLDPAAVAQPPSMGVNATGTLGGGSQVERRRRENRGAVGGEWVWEGLCPFPENL